MNGIELFSKRLAKQTFSQAEVYSYDVIPERLRNQIIYIWDERLGDKKDYGYYSDFAGHSGYSSVVQNGHWKTYFDPDEKPL